MANYIKIKEDGNRLEFSETYKPVVCGNSNYFVIFDFSEEWFNCDEKTAVFIIGDKKKMKKFRGHVLQLPVFPNAPYVSLLVHTKKDDEYFTTSAIKIRLEPTPIGDLLNV